MKKILFVALISLLFTVEIFSQFDSGYPKYQRSNSEARFLIEATMGAAATDSLVTGWQDISDFDATNEYWQVYTKLTTNGALATDTGYVSIDVYGNESASWTGAVNIGQIVDTTSSETAFYTASTLSNKRPTYVNFVIENVSNVSGGNNDDSLDVSVVIKIPIKDAKVADE